MPTVYDVPADLFIARLALELKEGEQKIQPPPWAWQAKTGAHVERQPNSDDWWYVRAASLMRKLYIHGPVGVSRLTSAYGGRENRGLAAERAWSSGGNAVRKVLQQLEALGFVAKKDKRGRVLTSKGKAFMDEVATALLKTKAKP